MKVNPPPHPGQRLERYLSEHDMTQKELAHEAEVSPPQVHYIVAQKRLVSVAMAHRLQLVTGIPADEWLEMSEAYDKWQRAHAEMADEKGAAAGGSSRHRDLAHARMLQRWVAVGIHTLTDERVVEAVKEGYVDIDPFDEDRLSPASYDLCFDDEVLIKRDGRIVHKLSDFPNGVLELRKGELCVVRTRERIRLPTRVFGRLSPMTRLGRAGVAAYCGMHVDPTYAGRLFVTLEVRADMSFDINPGDPFLTLELVHLPEAPATVYTNEDDQRGRELFSNTERTTIQGLNGGRSEERPV